MVTQEIVTPPEDYKEAISQNNAPTWIAAMQTEIEQHQKIGTWELIDLPSGRTAIGCRWVYAIKTTPEGIFEKAKGHLVAQGFTQCPGMDYYEITSPVLKFASLRVLIALGTVLNWEI